MKKHLFTRNFTLLLLGQTISLLGNFTLKFALSMYVLEQTGSASVFAGLLAMAMLPTILLSPFGGILADRANRRNIMVTLDLLSGVSVLLTAWAMHFYRDIVVIGALLVFLSVLSAFESPTVQACVPQILSGDALLQGNMVVNQVTSITSLITPFLGSYVYNLFGIRTVLYAAVFCFFITALFECFFQLRQPEKTIHKNIFHTIKEEFSVGLRFLRKEQPHIMKLLLLVASINFFIAGAVVVGLPFLIRTILGLSTQYSSVAESAMGAAAILGSFCIGLLKKRFRLRHLSAVLLALGGALILAGLAFAFPISLSAQYCLLLVMFCAFQLGCSIFSTYGTSIIQGKTPQAYMGKIMSYVSTLCMCTQPFGQLIYGRLFDLFSHQVYLVLIPSGLVISMIALASKGFFIRLEQK